MNVLPASDPAVRLRLSGAGWNAGPDTVAAVAEIVAAVTKNGDAALVTYSRRYDDADFQLSKLRVPIPMREQARSLVPFDVAAAIELARDRLARFHERQRQADLSYAEEDGSRYGFHREPLEAVAVYVPRGAGMLISPLLMGVVPAKIAGVRRTIVLTPPRRGGVHPAVLFACSICGVDELYAVGGAQAIAAAALGTESIAPVEKIVGPGGVWVTEAKRQMFGRCGIDALAGPSELLVVADEGANSEYVAGELLAHAEQSEAARLVVVSESRPLLEAVAQLLDTLGLRTLERGEAIDRAIERNGLLLHAASRAEVIAVIEELAPAYLCLQVRDAASYLPHVRRAGAVFVGDLTPSACGAYLAGTNHVVPTAGTSRWASALRLEDFMRTYTVLEYSVERMMNDAIAIATLADLEGLPQHAQTARMRYGG